MLKKLVDKRKWIAIILTVILFILWGIGFIFGNGEDKVVTLILTLILPLVYYGFIWLLFQLVVINAPPKVVNFFLWFFLLMGAYGVLMAVVEFISGFPNGLSPALGGCMGVVVSVLSQAKKYQDTVENK